MHQEELKGNLDRGCIMKISKIELFQLPPRWLFLRVETDSGFIGWGEPVVEGKAATVKTAVEELSEIIIGQDARKIEDIWQQLYRGSFYRGGPILMSAIAGIDQALWDIKGKYFNVPVYELLGGPVRNKIQAYSWIGGDRPQDVVSEAKARKELGFDAIKMNATSELHYIDKQSLIDKAEERVEAIRDELGPDFGIGIDFHGRVHKAMAAKLISALDKYNPMFIEEPVLSENWDALIRQNNYSTPIALGERLFSRWDFKEIFKSGVVDIIQPDLSHAGGITECKKIADMAEAFDVAVAFHCPLGPISLAACLQVDAIAPNAFIQEQSAGIHYNQGADLYDYIKNPEVLRPKDGYFHLIEESGLGVNINEEFVRSQAVERLDWRNPIWRNHDGTIAEW